MNRLRGLGSCLPVSLFCHITCICPFFALHFVCQQNTFIINEGQWSSDGLKLQYWALNTLSLLFFNIKGSLLLILLIVFVLFLLSLRLCSPHPLLYRKLNLIFHCISLIALTQWGLVSSASRTNHWLSFWSVQEPGFNLTFQMTLFREEDLPTKYTLGLFPAGALSSKYSWPQAGISQFCLDKATQHWYQWSLAIAAMLRLKLYFKLILYLWRRKTVTEFSL